ncbi:Coiled-coil and C2 domain-containing protein 1B [Entomortierella beljakovae]|nr:Coiled-coil and C2 domain-containing protein 1B [Entomortierella beljakovae]
MFSWKKQNPPSQRQQQPSDYGDIIAQGMKLANEDINVDNDDMDDINDEDIDDIDLDDPELLAELQGLTGGVSASKPKPKPAPTPSQSAVKTPVPAGRPPAARPAAPVAPQQRSSPAANASAPKAQSQAADSAPAASSLAGLGVDLDGIMKDDDEEVELTEDDWNDPHLMAQLQLLGGHAEQVSGTTTKPAPPPKATAPTPLLSQTPPDLSNTVPSSPQSTYSSREHKPASVSSSMIAIPPKDNAYIDDDLDGDSFMAEQEEVPLKSESHPAPSPSSIPQKPAKEPVKKNDPSLLKLLQTRHAQYKRAALNAGRIKNSDQLKFYVSKYKMLQLWINKVESGEYLDPTLFTIPDEPPIITVNTTEDVEMPPAPKAIDSPAALSARSVEQEPKSLTPLVPPPGATAQESQSATAGPTTPGKGIEIKQLSKFDDFHIVSSSNDDTYDMLQSQLESQIDVCTTAYKYYYMKGDKQTAVKFRKLQKNFQADLTSLQSYRSHGKPAPAFHFQDVRFELEVGFHQEIGVNDLSLNIIKAWDLSHKDVQPSDIEPYVIYDLGWPTEKMAGAGTGKGTTPTVKKTSRPEFNYSKTLGIQRTTAFQRFVDKKKLILDVWHYRGLLWKDYLIGRAQVPLSALLKHSEIHEIVPLLDPNNRRSTGGKIEVKIRLQQPLLSPEIVIKEEKWLVIDEFNSSGVEFPAPISTVGNPTDPTAAKGRAPLGPTKVAVAPASRAPTSPASTRSTAPVSKPIPPPKQPVAPPKQPAAAASPSTSSAPPANNSRVTPATPKVSAPAAKPAGPASSATGEPEETESEKALNELNNVDLLVSNVVLEYEIQRAKAMMQEAQSKGNNDAVEEYQDRLSQLEIKMQLLVIKVQTGQLTMDGYCQSVNERIKKDKNLAITLKRLGMTNEAMIALARSKKMEGEMKEVEEAMAAQAGDE